MNLTLKRHTLTKSSTIGMLSLNGTPFCATLEDTVRPATQKIWGQTAIPAGSYKVIIDQSARFSKEAGKPVFLPLLLDVPGFAGVRIHCGNCPADTEGCILVGVYSKSQPDWISESRNTFDKLFPQIKAAYQKGEPITITVV